MFLHPLVEIAVLAEILLPAVAAGRWARDRWRRRRMYRVLRDMRRVLDDGGD